jgi:hydrogenase maturation protease
VANSSTATKQNKTLVLGLGNVIMGDEGVGVHVVRALEQHPLPANVECLDGGTGGFTLLEPLQEAGRIILIDAAADGNPPGTVTRTTPKFSRDYPPTLTAHDIGVKDLLDVFYIQGGGPNVVLYAITIDPKQSISMDLSSVIAKAAEVAVAEILAELQSNSTA